MLRYLFWGAKGCKKVGEKGMFKMIVGIVSIGPRVDIRVEVRQFLPLQQRTEITWAFFTMWHLNQDQPFKLRIQLEVIGEVIHLQNAAGKHLLTFCMCSLLIAWASGWSWMLEGGTSCHHKHAPNSFKGSAVPSVFACFGVSDHIEKSLKPTQDSMV